MSNPINTHTIAVVSAQERRTHRRNVTFLKGTIVQPDGSTGDHVSIENLSDCGARLKVACERDVGEEITLDIPARQERRRAYVCWRLSHAIGVRFQDGPLPIPRWAQSDVAARLIELEQEVRRFGSQRECLSAS